MRIHLLGLCVLSLALPAADEDYRAAAPVNQRPMLGVEMTPVPASVQDREGLNPHQGVLVQSVYENTAASGMGLRPGDVILHINGAPITSMTDLRNEMGLTGVGDQVQVQVTRNGQPVAMQSQVKEWPANVPYEKLDAAAERRFRDWQDRRQQRLAEDLQRSKQELANMKKSLLEDSSDQDGTEQGPGPGAAPGADAAKLPAFRLRLSLATEGMAPYGQSVPEFAADPALPSSPAWTFQIALPGRTLL